MQKPFSESTAGSVISLINVVNPWNKGGFRVFMFLLSLLLSTSVYVYFSQFYGQDNDFLKLLRHGVLPFQKPTYIFYGSDSDDTPYGRIERQLHDNRDITVKSPRAFASQTSATPGAMKNAFGVMTHAKSFGIIQHDTLHMSGILREPMRMDKRFVETRMQTVTPLYVEKLHILASVKNCGSYPLKDVRVRDMLLTQCIGVAMGEKGHIVMKTLDQDAKAYGEFQESLNSKIGLPFLSPRISKGTYNYKNKRSIKYSTKDRWKDVVKEVDGFRMSNINCGAIIINESTESNKIYKETSGLKIGTPGSSSSIYAPYLFGKSLGRPFYTNHTNYAKNTRDLLDSAEIMTSLNNGCKDLKTIYDDSAEKENSTSKTENKYPIYATQVRMFMSGAPYPNIQDTMNSINRENDAHSLLIGVDHALINQIRKDYDLQLIPTHFRGGSYQTFDANSPSADYLPTAGAYAWLVGSSSLTKKDKIAMLNALGEGIENDRMLAKVFSNPPVSLDDVRKSIETDVQGNNTELLLSFIGFLFIVIVTTLLSMSSLLYIVSTAKKTAYFQKLTLAYYGVKQARENTDPSGSIRAMEEIGKAYKNLSETSVNLREDLEKSLLIEKHYTDLMKKADEIVRLLRQEMERELIIYMSEKNVDATKRLDDTKERIYKAYSEGFLSEVDYDRLMGRFKSKHKE